MGACQSSGGSIAPPADDEPPKKTSMTGKPVRGSFSPGGRAMAKVRSRSDIMLAHVLDDRSLFESFYGWLAAQSEGRVLRLLHFVVEARGYRDKFTPPHGHSGAAIDKDCNALYGRFCVEGAPEKINFDAATSRQLQNARRHADHMVYALASEKMYQVLKFEYLPKYLTSTAFNAMTRSTLERRGSGNPLQTMRGIMSEPSGRRALADYFDKRREVASADLVLLWEEVSDFADAPSDKRRARAQKLLGRFEPCPAECPAKRFEPSAGGHAKEQRRRAPRRCQIPAEIQRVLRDRVADGSTPSPGSFDVLASYILDILEARHGRDFLCSKEYTSFAKGASAALRHDSTVVRLQNFRNRRQLDQTKDAYAAEVSTMEKDVATAMKSPMWASYFRRFARLHLAEENVLFWQEVQFLRTLTVQGEDPPAADATAVTQEDMNQRIVRVYERFVGDDAPYQINIPGTMRDDLDVYVSRSSDRAALDLSVFDEAQAQVYGILNDGILPAFKAHTLYESFRRAHFQRFAMREFVTGDDAKAERTSRSSARAAPQPASARRREDPESA